MLAPSSLPRALTSTRSITVLNVLLRHRLPISSITTSLGLNQELPAAFHLSTLSLLASRTSSWTWPSTWVRHLSAAGPLSALSSLISNMPLLLPIWEEPLGVVRWRADVPEMLVSSVAIDSLYIKHIYLVITLTSIT